MSKEAQVASLVELLKSIGFEIEDAKKREHRESVKKLYLAADDPRLDYNARTDITEKSIITTLPIAKSVSDLDGMACEQIAIPVLGFLALGGKDPDVMEEISHLALRGFGMAFGSYIEQHVVNAIDVEYAIESILVCLRHEVLSTIQLAARTRALAEAEAEEEKKP